MTAAARVYGYGVGDYVVCIGYGVKGFEHGDLGKVRTIELLPEAVTVPDAEMNANLYRVTLWEQREQGGLAPRFFRLAAPADMMAAYRQQKARADTAEGRLTRAATGFRALATALAS